MKISHSNNRDIFGTVEIIYLQIFPSRKLHFIYEDQQVQWCASLSTADQSLQKGGCPRLRGKAFSLYRNAR